MFNVVYMTNIIQNERQYVTSNSTSEGDVAYELSLTLWIPRTTGVLKYNQHQNATFCAYNAC